MKKETKKSSKDSKVKGLSFGRGKEVRDKNGVVFRLKKGYVEVAKDDNVCNQLKGHCVIPDEIDGHPVRCIRKDAFKCCKKLTSISIPDSVTTIGESAFEHCEGLKNVTIPNSVTRLGNFAFYGCCSLTNITIGDGVKAIEPYLFGRCGGLETILVGEGNCSFTSANGLLLTKDGKTLIKGVNGDVTIPDGVTCIAECAFQDCKSLTSIAMSDGIATIDKEAFQGCKSLRRVSLPVGLKRIGSHAFHKCDNLKTVTIPSGVTDIGGHAFHGAAIEKIIIPNSVTSIGDMAFCSNCGLKSIVVGTANPRYKVVSGLLLTRDGTTLIAAQNNLSNVTIPDGVNYMAAGAFEHCKPLKSVKIPGSVKFINTHTFACCHSLANVTIEEGVEEICNFAFSHCEALKSILIPDSVTTLALDAFNDCKRLKTLSLPKGLEEEIGDRLEDASFWGLPNLKTVYRTK